MNHLAALIVNYTQRELDLPETLTSGMGLRILEATTAARLRLGDASLAEIAAEGDIPLGTIKAARARMDGLREAMDAAGAEAPGLIEDHRPENTVRLESEWWLGRPAAQRRAWISAVGCDRGFHEAIDALDRAYPDDRFDEEMENLLAAQVPVFDDFVRLTGGDRETAANAIDQIDWGHRFVDGPVPRWATLTVKENA
jgi:hypothetical protein